jgi:hypothetical protein
MDPRKLSFLQAVIGSDGAGALTKATHQRPDLEWALFPRVVMSWLEVASHAGEYAESVPGTKVNLNFRKSEDGFTGHVSIGPEVYSFRDATLYHVAGSVAVALGATPEHAPELRSPALAKLGKSVDLLVRARTLRKMQQQRHGGAKGTQPKAQAAAAIAPAAPALPQPTQPKQPSNVGTKVGTQVKTNTASPKLPGIKRPSMKVTKAEASGRCPVCASSLFKADRFTGCLCLAELAKSVKTTVTSDGYNLDLSGWDAEAISTLADTFGK